MKLSNNRQHRLRRVLIILLMLSMVTISDLNAISSGTTSNPASGQPAETALAHETAGERTVGTPTPQTASPPETSSSSPPSAEVVPPPPMPNLSSIESKHSDPMRYQITKALLQESFTYEAKDMVDPFVPFIAPVETAPVAFSQESEESDLPPVPQKPLTPLQKMSLSEIEKGLKAITWGDLGRKAIIEDAAGKGYIVSVGTPAGDKNGVITEIFNDRMVIQQESWDKKLKRMVPQNALVKLKKEREK